MDLSEIRLRIQDPFGVLYFLKVDELPIPLKSQTAYIINGEYYVDGEIVELKVSDERIEAWSHEYNATLDSVTVKALEACKFNVAMQLTTVKHDSGAESTEYVKMLELQKFYDNEISKLKIDDSPIGAKYAMMNTPDYVGSL